MRWLLDQIEEMITMAVPPPTPPSSDIKGVNRDARVQSPSKDHPDPGGAVQDANEGSTARPDETPPAEGGKGEGLDR